MSCKAGNKNHKARCQQYKSEGRRELNKKKKAARHEKRMQRFAERRESGKCYQYDKKRTEKKIKDRVPIGTNLGSNKRTDVAEWDSISAKLNKIYEEEKKKAQVAAAAKSKKDDGQEG